ncbi:hypothetical protein [Gardnerella greenwoodii]|uniref:Uncharacterized protein n=1 Tax=Gardnerella greenwoodii 00703Dmash TaxID=698960 RepID=I4M947_9BIFI|nr:hypothetical protein [Gardnerella greenwoodii]EIK85737.1 hypothetical protein CGSMWGv00703Dmash_02900 [Gardnerella greenwoodii 00703Dmash]
MLPAKFRGFASRVGRLASRALAWRKTSERDAAVRTSSNVTIACTAHPAHTLRRALFAMFVAAATIVTMLIVPPVKEANATQAWWDYAGNGYFTDGNFWVGDAVRDISITYPNIEYNQWDSDYGKSGTKISWDIVFNQESIGFASASLKQLPHGNQPKDGASWEGRPLFIVFLPKGLRDGDRNNKSSVYITRTKTVRTFDNELHKFVFSNEVKHNHQRPAEFATGRNYSYADGDKDFQTVWNATFGKYGEKATCGEFKDQYGFCEIRKWRGSPNNPNDSSNKFGRVLADWGQADTTYGYKWHIEAFVEDGVNPETLPIIAGWNSNGTLGSWGSGTRNKWAAMGPFDTDGDGIPDYVEHQVKMNPTNGDEISYPQYNNSDDKKYGQDNIPITTYHRPVTVKPFARTGEWGGDSSHGSFEYDGGTTTNLPTNLGIKYELTNKIPEGVRVVNSSSKMPEGSVYIDSRTGHVTYNPRKEDKGKVLEFGTKITYPNPSRYPYNCKYYDRGSFVTEQHPTKIKVVSQASLYNPVYTPVDLTEKTGQDQRDVNPIVYTAKPQSVKDPSKKHADSIQAGDLPKDATFELKQYVKGKNRSDSVLDWSHIDSQYKNSGQVRFYSNKWREPGDGKFRTPVVVHYADGSNSTDDDAANVDARGDFSKSVVYASVNLKRPNPNDSELKLNIYKGYGSNNLGDNGSVTIDVNDPLKPSIWIDSWAQYQIGQISLKSLCWKETKEGNSVKKENYTFSDLSKTNNDNTINGLTFKQTEKWPHASDSEQETCFANGTCNSKKLFDKDAFTIERSRGEISGTPEKGGKYVCRVFALRDGSQAKTDFDTAVNKKNYNVTLPKNSQKFDWQSKTVTFVAHSLAHKYNPQYKKSYVKILSEATSAAPVSHRGANGAGNDKSQQDLVPEGTSLPKGTWFELKKYSKHSDSKDKLSWSSFKDKQSNKKQNKNEAEDTTSDTAYGKVTFKPLRGTELKEYFAPVIVHYSDGSTSEDPDSGNLGKPVYAPVSVTNQQYQDDDLKLKVYSHLGAGGRQIEDNDNTGIRFRPGEVLGDATGNTKPMFFDSWSSAKPGKIYQRMLCYKKNPQTGKPESYEIDGVNGLKLAGRDGNTQSGSFVVGKPSQWLTATEKQRNECKADGSKCNRNLYLYGDEHDTTERTWGWLQGNVNKNSGDFVCTVYAIKDLENGSKHGDLQTKFDTELNKFVKNPGDRNFEDVIKTVLKDQKGSKNNPIDATQRHVDWDSVTFPIHVHNDAHYYNPQYIPLTMEAGTKQATALPTSAKDANGADKLQDDVRVGDLPDGTWFEFKKSLSYTFFEDDQDNKADSGNSAKNPTGKFGKVTFRPHRWFPAASEKTQVIVHYPDNSTSEDKDSGNNGKPIYATVNITRKHDEYANNLHLNVGDKEGSGDWQNLTISLSKDEELKTANQTIRWLDSWSVYKPGKINLRTICHKVNPDGTMSHYQSGGIAGIKMQDVKIWDHTEDAKQQKACENDRSKCHPDTQLYDDYITNGNSRNTTERTRGWIKGTANETGDYECVVYAIKNKQHLINDNDDLLDRFDKAVKSITPDKNGKVTPSNTDPLSGFKWNLDGDTGKTAAVEGVDYAKRTIPIHIHTQAHKYNPVYEKVSVQAGKEVQSGLPKNKKPTGDQVKTDSLAYQAIANGEAFPDGTWFELKKEASSPANYANAYDWSFWKNGQKDSNAPKDQSNPLSQDPTNPLNHSGKDVGVGSGSKYGNVTFRPDVTIAAKDYYQTHVIVHYPDGSTSDNPDAGNNQFKASSSATSTMNPVFAKVQVTDLGYKGTDLRMVLTKAKDTDSPLNSKSDLTVMKGIGLLKNPFVQAWSVKDKGKINLRMMCTKQGENKWSHGLENTLNMHLGNGYGESTPEWTFANEAQQKECRENGFCHAERVLYGLLNDNAQPGSVESAVARREEEIEGDPKETGTYSCSVFALKDKALDAFNKVVTNGSTSTDMWNINLSSDGSLVKSKDWDRISFKVNVVEKFALPKTGGDGLSMVLLVVAMIGMCVMCGAFFVDQTKWGHAMLVGAAGGVAGAAAGMMCGLRSATQAVITRNSNGNRDGNSNRNPNSKISEIWRGLVKKVKNIRRFDDYSVSVKDFVRKATGWLRAALRRVGRWAAERWRC